MTFQPFQAILQILQSSSISRESTPLQHSPIRMHILQFDWFPQKLHRVPVEQLQTFYKHYILQRKGDVAISVRIDRFSRIELSLQTSCHQELLITRMTFNSFLSCLMSKVSIVITINTSKWHERAKQWNGNSHISSHE